MHTYNGNALVSESVKRHLAHLRADLAGTHPTSLEKLLIDQVALSFLAVRQAEYAEATTSGGSSQQALVRLKRSESTQRRLLASIRLLTTLRALMPNGLVPADNLKLFRGQRETA